MGYLTENDNIIKHFRDHYGLYDYTLNELELIVQSQFEFVAEMITRDCDTPIKLQYLGSFKAPTKYKKRFKPKDLNKDVKIFKIR